MMEILYDVFIKKHYLSFIKRLSHVLIIFNYF